MQNPSPVNLRALTQTIASNDCSALTNLFSLAQPRKVFVSLVSALRSGSAVSNDTARYVLAFLAGRGIGVDYEAGALLQTAVEQGLCDTIGLLFDRGANPNISLLDGRTPLQVAAALGSQDDRFIRPKDGAADGQAAAVINLLCEHEAIITAPGVVCAAAAFRSLDVIRSLVERGGSINDRDVNGRTPLFFCADALPVIRYCITQGAEVNARDHEAKTPLMAAVSKSRSDTRVIQTLIKAGADVNALNKYGFTALMFAASTARMNLVQALINAGADCTIQNNQGMKAVDVAKKSPYPSLDVVAFLEKY